MANTELIERYNLIMNRIEQIPYENEVKKPYLDYFVKTSKFILMIRDLEKKVENGLFVENSFDELLKINSELYEDINEKNYNKSYGNPRFCNENLGIEYGQILCFLYCEIRGMISYAYEKDIEDITLYSELFVQIYNLFEYDTEPSISELKNIIYWFNSDYSEIFIENRIKTQFDYKNSYAMDIIMNSDLTDLRYLFKYGTYISDNEIKTAEFLNFLPMERIKTMADAMSEGYRIGFAVGNKDLSKKETVVIQFAVGFERVIREVIKNFEKINLKSIVYRPSVNSINRVYNSRAGYVSTSPNKQYEYDHKDDAGLYFDKPFMERKLAVLSSVYEQYKDLLKLYAGPAVLETFGEIPYEPESKKEAISLDEKQKKLHIEYVNRAKILLNNYVKMEECSFTIIAFPVYEIGKDFEKIFDEIININTLDYNLYQNIQQTIIDTLDKAKYVEIKGMNGNCTELRVNLCSLNNPEKETKFENCVADVNIPVGEVFTSPKLSGTDGVLNVSSVYLNGLLYKNIKLYFKNGMLTDYNCDNFDNESENKTYIRENVLFNHDTLPMGEFAIGTNTLAYIVAKEYDIVNKLPILIAEKMGPHFALGDTCYSYAEDIKVYNPNNKEIVCRDNEITSANRKEAPQKAYFNCHTDVTIPYDELGELVAVNEDGSRISIIEKGRFVLEGTKELNKPFEK